MGRNRTPTKLKLLRGNPGHRPIAAGEPSPAPTAEIPDCPTWLGDEAKREWYRIMPELHRLGLITTLDLSAAAAYCSATGQFIEAETDMRRIGKELAKVKDSKARSRLYFERNLAIGMRRQSLKEMNTYLAHFGLSPASRSKATAATGQGELPLGMGPGGPNESPLSRAQRLAGSSA